MARPGPKSKTKNKSAPKSKKVEAEKPELEEKIENEDDAVEKENDVKEEENDSADGVDGQSEEEIDEPPAKKGRGRPGANSKKGKKSPAKKVTKATSRARKTPATKKAKESEEESEEDEEKEWEVECILDQRTRKGKKEYRIKWKGFKPGQSTWEPEENLNCDEAIKEFEETQKNKKTITAVAQGLRTHRKETERYADTAGHGQESKLRHSRRGPGRGTPRKSYREERDDEIY